MERKIIAFSMVVMLVLGMTFAGGCSSQPAAQPDQKNTEPIKVGGIFPITGSNAKPGTGCKYALEMAIDEINEAGGIYGRPLQLIFEDDEGQPAVSVAAAEKLCIQDEVVAVIGAFNSSCVLAHMQVTEREKVPQINPVAFASSITRPMRPYMFRNVPQANLIAMGIGEFFINESGAETYAFIRENTDYGLDYEVSIGGYIESQGKTILTKEAYNPGDTDFYAQLTKIRDLKPEAIVMIANMAEGAQILKQRQELGIDVPLFASGSCSTPQFYELAGSAADGVYSLSFLEVTPESPPAVIKYDTDYRDRFGIEPDVFSIAAYDAVYILKAGLENAYKANGEKWFDDLAEFREAVRAGIKAVDGIPCLQGDLHWNEYQEAPANSYWVQWQPGGTKKVVGLMPAEVFAELDKQAGN